MRKIKWGDFDSERKNMILGVGEEALIVRDRLGNVVFEGIGSKEEIGAVREKYGKSGWHVIVFDSERQK